MNNTFIANYLERLDNLHKSFREAIEGLPPVAMDWVPGEEMNSVAVLLAHTTGSLRYWIGDIALGEPSGRDRESEFKTRGVSSEEMQLRLDAVFAYARTALPRLKLEDLEKEATTTANGERHTLGWALLHAMEHGYTHLGHIHLTKQLWKLRAV